MSCSFMVNAFFVVTDVVLLSVTGFIIDSFSLWLSVAYVRLSVCFS